MWPFRPKVIAPPTESLADQINISLKSLRLPDAAPNWLLFAKTQERWDTEKAIMEGYNASAVVYACIEKRAKLLAAVPWVAEQLSGGEWEHRPESPLQRLWDNPNPDQSGYELVYSMSQSLDLSGNCFLSEIKGGAGGLPFELWHLPTQHTRIIPGRESLVAGYEYEEQGIRRRIDAEDMTHIRMPNPGSRYFGMPVLMAAGRAADVDREAGDWQKASLQNRGILDMVVKVPPEATAEQRQEIRDKLKERQSGPANARQPIVTSGDIHQMGQTAAEMDFSNSRRRVWEELSVAFGVPLAALGLTEAVNLANANAMRRVIYEDTIAPQLKLIERQINNQLAPEFGPGWRLRPDLSAIPAMQENLGEKLDNARKLWELGVPFNTISAELELGFEEIEGGDVGYLPAGRLPANFDLPPADPITGEEARQQGRTAYGEE